MRISLRLLGHCLGLVQGDQRTLAANLGAAAQYQLADRDSLNLSLGQATVVYVEGFFLSHSPEVVMEIARFCQAEKMMFVFNLCGEYVCQDLDYCRNVIKLLPFIKFLFGNKNEYDVFIKTVSLLDLEDDVKQCVDKLIEGAASSDEENLQLVEDCDIEEDHQFCIVTNSNQPVHCFAISNHSYSCSVTVPDLPRELIKDSIGAGDSFIAGFLWALSQNRALVPCVEHGIVLAQCLLKETGVCLPKQKPDFGWIS